MYVDLIFNFSAHARNESTVYYSYTILRIFVSLYREDIAGWIGTWSIARIVPVSYTYYIDSAVFVDAVDTLELILALSESSSARDFCLPRQLR